MKIPSFKLTDPLAVVEIKRHGKWMGVFWLYEGKQCDMTAILAPTIGVVTGVRIKRLKKGLTLGVNKAKREGALG